MKSALGVMPVMMITLWPTFVPRSHGRSCGAGCPGPAGPGTIVAAMVDPAEPPPAVAPALRELSRLIGGTWETQFKTADGKPVGQFSYRWGPEKRTIHSEGTLAGAQVQTVFGWDPVAKKVYFVDMHGPETVYFGHAVMDGEVLVFDFKTLVGAPATYRSREWFVDQDNYKAVIQELRDGEVRTTHTIQLKRVR